MNCPQCDGPIYDNTQKVADGWKGPLKKCKDKDGCGWVQWPPRGAKKGAAQGNGASHGPKWTWPSLNETYRKCMRIAAKHVKDHVPNAQPADVIAAAATVFIAASNGGVKPEEKPASPPDEE